jgi:anthranilate synthase/aminodeoxychorismate synthase-like glutamine amidotransferase
VVFGLWPVGKKTLVIDNYDSFTFNLVQYLGELGADLEVFRNDAMTLAEIRDREPNRIVISPGPGTPASAGISVSAVQEFAGMIPILGVCLGHQSIGEAFGGSIVKTDRLMHGKTSMVYHRCTHLFADLESPFEATRYHSLIVSRRNLPACLEVTAWTEDETIMGIQHRDFPVFGVQFHPESIMTKAGKRLLDNFLCYGDT